MKTLFLWPAFGERHSKYPPLGIAYIAAVIRENNLPVEIVDAARFTDYGEFEIELRQRNPDVLGISVLSVYYDKALEAARIARKTIPPIKIVFGGPHPTMLPKETIRNPEVDVVVLGEGEIKYRDLLLAWREDRNLDTVKGIYYKAGSRITKTPDSEYIQNLDLLPFPARDLLPMSTYLQQAPTLPLPSPSTTILASRGCYGNCRFCQPTLRKLFGREIRYRSPKNVVDEIIFLKKAYNLKGVYLADDEPTWKKDWMMEFCEEINRRQVKIAWLCASRVDTIDLEMLHTMKKAGCIQIGFGVESGSQKILNYYRKGVRIDQVAPAFDMCKKVGIIARANIMIGAPLETQQEVQETIQLLKRIKPDLIALSVTTPTVGTDLFTEAQRNDLLREENLSRYDRFHIGTMKRELSDLETRQIIKSIVAVYFWELIKVVFNPVALYRRRFLFYHVLMHWFTVIKHPRVLMNDILYYLNYASKEKME